MGADFPVGTRAPCGNYIYTFVFGTTADNYLNLHRLDSLEITVIPENPREDPIELRLVSKNADTIEVENGLLSICL
jgi:hypothetical protein